MSPPGPAHHGRGAPLVPRTASPALPSSACPATRSAQVCFGSSSAPRCDTCRAGPRSQPTPRHLRLIDRSWYSCTGRRPVRARAPHRPLRLQRRRRGHPGLVAVTPADSNISRSVREQSHRASERIASWSSDAVFLTSPLFVQYWGAFDELAAFPTRSSRIPQCSGTESNPRPRELVDAPRAGEGTLRAAYVRRRALVCGRGKPTLPPDTLEYIPTFSQAVHRADHVRAPTTLIFGVQIGRCGRIHPSVSNVHWVCHIRGNGCWIVSGGRMRPAGSRVALPSS